MPTPAFARLETPRLDLSLSAARCVGGLRRLRDPGSRSPHPATSRHAAWDRLATLVLISAKEGALHKPWSSASYGPRAAAARLRIPRAARASLPPRALAALCGRTHAFTQGRHLAPLRFSGFHILAQENVNERLRQGCVAEPVTPGMSLRHVPGIAGMYSCTSTDAGTRPHCQKLFEKAYWMK